MFPPAMNDPRLAALSDLKIMGTAAEERFDRITRMARELFDVPMAEIHLLDDETLFTKSPQLPGAPVEYPREGTFCDSTLQKARTVVIPDLGFDDEFAAHENVVGPPYVRFYAGRPLTVDHGQQVGTICLLDMVPRELSVEQQRLLDEFGRWVERELQDTAERDRAAELQSRLLPTAVVHPRGYRLRGLSLPLRQITGDFFDWRVGEEAIFITVADVMGKGAAAAILGSGVRAAFAARPGGEPPQVVHDVNTQVVEDLTATSAFATVFHTRLDVRSGLVDYVDAGHGLAMIVRADGAVHRLASIGLPIGISAEAEWRSESSQLGPGDHLVVFTDGLLDLYDGTLESLTQIATAARSASDAEEFLAGIRELAGGGAATDDITVLVLSRE